MTTSIVRPAALFPNGDMLVSLTAKAQSGVLALNAAHELAWKQIKKDGLEDVVVAGVYATTLENQSEGFFIWDEEPMFDELLAQEYEVKAERDLERRLEDSGWMDTFEEEQRNFYR